MKSINLFSQESLLTVHELLNVRGGGNPPSQEDEGVVLPPPQEETKKSN